MGVTWALSGVCVLIVAARFYVRSSVNGKISSDDWFMLLALAIQLVFQGCITEAFNWGLGKHDADIPLPNLPMIMKWNYISTTPAVLVSMMARISANILLTRLFSNKRMLKWFLWSFTAFQAVCSIVLIAFVWAQVDPVEGLWNPLMPARRWDPRIQLYTSYLTQSAFTFSDLTYVLFPVLIIWNLHMPTRQKVGLVLLMCLSLVTAVASIMKTVTTPRADAGPKPDAQYTASIAVLWSGVEQTLVIILGCIAPLRAKFIQIMRTHFGWIGAGLVGIVTGSKGTKDRSERGAYGRQSSSGAQWTGNSTNRLGTGHHYDVEVERRGSSEDYLRPEVSLGASDGSLNSPRNPPVQGGQQMADVEMGNGHIRRTDFVSVTFENEGAQPKATV